MKYVLQQSRLQHLLQSRNGYLMLASGSIGLNILLVLFLFCTIGRERIVVVPPEIQKSFWVTSSLVSPEYLSEMVLFLNSLNFNVTPSNAPQQHAVLLRYVDPSQYAAVKMKLLEVDDRLKKEHVSIAFQPSHVKVDTKKLIAEVSGDLQYTVGDIPIAPQHVVYRWGFRYSQGRLLITAFPEVKKNA